MFDFLLIDKDSGFDVVFGSQWEIWCEENKGMRVLLVSYFVFTVTYPLPLTDLDITPEA